jgi:Asp-tRNA(Asn)/Glu-tRNA(Gln) amidotransferase A subunit family amidase
LPRFDKTAWRRGRLPSSPAPQTTAEWPIQGSLVQLGIVPPSSSFDTPGILARCMADVGLSFAALDPNLGDGFTFLRRVPTGSTASALPIPGFGTAAFHRRRHNLLVSM